MRKQIWSRIGVAAVAAAALGGGSIWRDTPVAVASDHDEAPAVKADAAVDITDLYVFESGPEKTTIIVCWAGLNDSYGEDIFVPTAEGNYDPEALYTIHIDNDQDNVADIQIHWRFGQDQYGNQGVRWEQVPGSDDHVVGLVETVTDVGTGARAWAGHADDPFFFDALGYLETVDTGTLSFASLVDGEASDSLAGLNVTAAAIELDTSLIHVDGPIQVWATSGKVGG